MLQSEISDINGVLCAFNSLCVSVFAVKTKMRATCVEIRALISFVGGVLERCLSVMKNPKATFFQNSKTGGVCDSDR